MKRYHGTLKPTYIETTSCGGGFAGYIECEVFQTWDLMNGKHIEIPGSRRKVAAFPNLITNHGLDCIGFYPQASGYTYGSHAHVGTGNAVESVADTTLDEYVASQAADGGYQQVYWCQSTPPYYASHKKRYRFAPNFGGGAINVAEIGISTQAATGGLFSRALVRTGGGDITTIAVAATEWLDVYYTLRLYADHVNYTTGATDDGTGSFSVEGTSYNYTIRVCAITNTNLWARNLFAGFNFSSWINGYTKGELYDDGARLNAVTEWQDSSHGTGTAYRDVWFYTHDHLRGTYAASTYTNTLTFDTPLDIANFAGTTNPGIKGLSPWSTIGGYQILLNNCIPKTSSQEFYYTHRTSWTRKSLL